MGRGKPNCYAVPRRAAANPRGRSGAGRAREFHLELDQKGRALMTFRSVSQSLKTGSLGRSCDFGQGSFLQVSQSPRDSWDWSSCSVPSIWENKSFILQRGSQPPLQKLNEIIHIKPIIQYLACSKRLVNGSHYNCFYNRYLPGSVPEAGDTVVIKILLLSSRNSIHKQVKPSNKRL